MNYPDEIKIQDILSKNWIDLINKDTVKNTECNLNDIVTFCKSKNLKIYPNVERIFYIFNKCELNNIRVVILGQDPYHQHENQANGMAFSVSNVVPIPPSLRNIKKELISCYPNKQFNNDLTHWVEQGVFLLNTSLTVTQNKPGSHIQLYSDFIKETIKMISNKSNIVFCLWGSEQFPLLLIFIYKSLVNKN
jgi:uracil-DNA glycosylase